MFNNNRRNLAYNTLWGGFITLLIAVSPALAQSARVAANSVSISPDAKKKELSLGFRLADAVDITSVSAIAEGIDDPIPATWNAWAEDKAPACAWMIVVDTSNSARAKTIASCVEDVRSFLVNLPKQDNVAVYSLALNLVEVAPFGCTPEDRSASLIKIKPDGDSSKTTLIYTNLREGLNRLNERKEMRKAVLLLTDGKDETPAGPDAKDGGAVAREIEKNKLIDAAKKAGIVIHTLGYAETASDQADFAPLKDISAQTDGIHRGAALVNKELPVGTHKLICDVMHGAGIVHLDLSKLEKPINITVTAKTAAGSEAVIKIPSEKVEEAIPPKIVTTDPTNTKPPEELAKEKAAADKLEKDKAEAAKKAAAEKEAADAKKRLIILSGSGVLLALILAALLMLRASRKRAEQQARLVWAARLEEEERAAEDARLAEAASRVEATKKTEAPPLAWLEMCDAQQTRHPVRISSLKIGRGQHNDLVLRNDSVSGNHCVLNCSREGEWSVTDLNSGNGVVLNGKGVQQAALRHADTIELGELKMRFLLRA